MSLELLILEGPQAGRRLPIGTGATTLGRSANAEVSFPWDNFISGTHLSIQADPVGVIVTDLHSTNGTFLNGQRITKAVANVGDTIKIGAMTMQVVAAQPQQSAPVLSAAMRPASTPAVAPPPTSSAPVSGATTVFQAMSLPPITIPEPPRYAPDAATTLVQFPAASEAPLPAPAAIKQESKNPAEQALTILKQQQSPLFCLLNAAEDDSLPATLLFSGLSLNELCLLQSDGSGPSPAWAPYLVPLSSREDLLSSLVRNGWGKGWSCFFTTSAPFEELKAHFGKFLKVQVERGGEVYFRFYDPRVLREFLPVASMNERTMFFGPVGEWLLEGEDRETMLRARNAADGLLTDHVRLL
jgi:hypothetical protein